MNKTKYFLALQAFQFDISIYYSLAMQFSLNWWCQSSISMNSGETKVDAIVFNSVKSGRKLEHWPPPADDVQFWSCSSLAQKSCCDIDLFFSLREVLEPTNELSLLRRLYCLSKPLQQTNFCNKERIPLWFQAPNNDKLRRLHTLKHRFNFHFQSYFVELKQLT